MVGVSVVVWKKTEGGIRNRECAGMRAYVIKDDGTKAMCDRQELR
jgi:hypothetical protein